MSNKFKTPDVIRSIKTALMLFVQCAAKWLRSHLASHAFRLCEFFIVADKSFERVMFDDDKFC